MPIKKIFRSMLRLALVVAAFVAIVLVSFYAVIQGVLRGAEVVEVPNVVRDSFVTGWDKLEEVGLKVAQQSKQYSSVVPQDHIIAQRPVAGSKVKMGRVVNVTISRGLEMLAVPNVTDEELRQAEIDLENANLAVGHVSAIHFPLIEGVVLGQDPRAGTSIETGGKVHLLVSAGRRLTKYLVPDAVGLKSNDAVQLLSQLKLVTQEEFEVRPQAAPGIVLAQEPARNQVIDEGGVVRLVVSTRSRERRWENLRYLVLVFEVPYVSWERYVRVEWERYVRIEMNDALGTETVIGNESVLGSVARLGRPFAPGEIITLPISYKLDADTKEVTVKVFVDGVLWQETTADASRESTIIFTYPWRDVYEIKDITIAPFSGLREPR
jgi:serine/threonine-protein kinase